MSGCVSSKYLNGDVVDISSRASYDDVDYDLEPESEVDPVGAQETKEQDLASTTTFKSLTEKIPELRYDILNNFPGKDPSFAELLTWCNIRFGGGLTFDPEMDLDVSQLSYWFNTWRENNIVKTQSYKIVRQLAASRDPEAFRIICKHPFFIEDKDDLQFWHNYVERKGIIAGTIALSQRYHKLLHGASHVYAAKRLTNIAHLQWWHEHYPNEGFDRIIHHIQNEKETAKDAVKANLTREQAQR